jgi:hypothetical protein
VKGAHFQKPWTAGEASAQQRTWYLLFRPARLLEAARPLDQ